MAKTENAIWVVAQLENDETLGVTYELLGQARRLADTVGWGRPAAWPTRSGRIPLSS